MRLKYFLEYVHLPAKARLLWLRITFSRVTTIYFVFSVVHCIVQVIIQVQAYSINAQASIFLSNLIRQGDAFIPGFAVMGNDLRYCEDIPSSLSADSCDIVWRAAARDSDTDSNASEEESPGVLEPAILPTSTSNGFSSSFAAITSTSSSVQQTSSSQQRPSSIQQSSSFQQTTRTQQTSTAQLTITLSTVTRTIVSSILPSSTSIALPPSPPPPATTVQATSAPPIIATISPVLAVDDVDSIDGISDDGVSDGVSLNSPSVDDDTVEDVEDIPNTAFAIPLKRRREVTINAVNINGSREVVIDGFGWNNERRLLSQSCLVSLNWPLEKLENTKREDIVFISFQLWVLGMSVVALLNESMPHIIASLLTHLLATAWGGFQIQHTAVFHNEFNRLTTNGACLVNLLPSYWKERAAAEIPSLVLNVVALFLSAFLSWRLVKLFGWQTFKRVGASRTIDRVYKLVLSLSIAIQLSTFFIVVSVALWIDQLYNGPIGSLARAAKLYKGLLITVLLLLLPWLYIGWIGVRRELKLHTAIFLIMAMAYLAGWGAMFTSITFKWTFTLWRFFSIITTGSVFLTIVTLILGIICRFNFGKGLPRYLASQEPLPGDDFKPAMQQRQDDLESEKIDFPSFEPIPTYSAMFNQGFNAPVVPPTTKSNPRLGPRFRNTTLEPFETQTNRSNLVRSDSLGYTWEVASSFSTTHSNNTTQLSRQASQRSNGTGYERARPPQDTAPPYSGRHPSTEPHAYMDRQKRWVIE